MDVKHEIAKQLEKLPPEMQEQVLRFATSLAGTAPAGESGEALLEFSSLFDSVSLQEMTEAIEAECERVDAGCW
ncbi:MAG: hypothetical protein JWP63_5390 [Candidatus Solibacter sp.]|nr:hypothetical protein [Candidatus Solibacter sp.]